MARSRKKMPFIGVTTAESEKDDKVFAHKRERRAVHIRLNESPVTDILPTTREVSNVWNFAKDGKTIVRPGQRRNALRK